MTGITHGRSQHTLLHPDQALNQFEGRTGRITAAYGTVEQRLPFVIEQLHIVIAPLPSHQFIGIVCGRGNHHQNLARRRFDRHGSPDFAGHQLLGEELQPRVDRADDRLAGYGQRIETTVHIRTLDRSVRIHLGDLHPLLTAQLRLVGRLHAADSDVFARLIRRITPQHFGIDLPHISQQVSPYFTRVLPGSPVNGIEAGEVTLVETKFVLLGHIVHHHTGRTRTHAGIGQLPHKPFARKPRNLTEKRRIEPLPIHLAIDHHQVITLATLYQIFAVAVEHLATGRILNFVAQRIAPGQLLIFAVDELNISKPRGDYAENDQHDHLQHPHPGNPFPTVTHSRTVSLVVNSRASSQMKPTVTAPLTTSRTSVWNNCAQDRDSNMKNRKWCTTTIAAR